MAFKAKGSLNPEGAPILFKSIITDDVVSEVNDSMKQVLGFASLGTAGVLVAGHVVAHVDDKGLGLNTTGVAGAEMGSYVNSWTASATNETVAKVAAQLDISKSTIYSVDPDATIGTTAGSNLCGYKTDLATEVTTDESTAAATTAQYNILGVDADDTGNQLVHIYESNFFGV